jgi:MFS family permease
MGFWALSAAFYLVATVINGSLVHIVPLLTDRGLPISVATAALSATGAALIVGRLCTGWLSDRVFAPYIALFFILFPMFGIAVLGFGGVSPIIGTICLGIGIGAEIDLMAFLVGRYFRLRQFGTLYGVMFAIAILGNATGSSLLGWSFQIFNSYSPAPHPFRGPPRRHRLLLSRPRSISLSRARGDVRYAGNWTEPGMRGKA